MKLDLKALPKDTKLLHQLVRDLVDGLEEEKKQKEDLTHQLKTKSQEVETLQHRLDQLTRYRYGRRSEKIDPNQRSLFENEIEEDIAETQAALDEISEPSKKPKKKKPNRKKLPPNLPRDEVRYDVDKCECAQCGGQLHRIGEETSEQLEYHPATFTVTRHVQAKYGCRSCESVVTADKPAQPIEKGIPGASLLAKVLISKYLDHLPLERQSKIYSRESGVELASSTLADWVGHSSWSLKPLVEALKDHLFRNTIMHTDDTVIPVLDPGNGKTRQGRLWNYLHTGCEGPPIVFFDYTPTRSADRPRFLLKDFKGYLHADRYPGYDRIYALGSAKEVGCNAHARRKFEELAKSSPIAQKAMSWIARLYQVEDKVERGSPDEYNARYLLRQKESKPILRAYKKWLDKTLTEVADNSKLAAAIRYTTENWTAMTRFLEDGRLHLDNNASERENRAVVLGRKNYLFAGSHLGAERAANIYTIIGTCKLNNVDPWTYLKDVLARIPNHPNKDIDELLPFNWKPLIK